MGQSRAREKHLFYATGRPLFLTFYRSMIYLKELPVRVNNQSNLIGSKKTRKIERQL
jgi:hypothetical protein